jgi:hypothetical protein
LSARLIADRAPAGHQEGQKRHWHLRITHSPMSDGRQWAG